jgi:glutaminyl-peptide cyclotransferase
MRKPIWMAFIVVCLLTSLLGCQKKPDAHFDGKHALTYVKAQCDLGPRPVGSEANRKTSDYIARELERNGWKVEFQEFAFQGYKLRNVIGKKGKGPLIVLGAHFDTRPLADKDPTDRSLPVPGANDGASGVAVLLELARTLDKRATDQAELWLAFFDGEDRGELNGWPWCVGSQQIAKSLTLRPEYVLVVDMVGDDDQRFYYEWTSTLWLQEKLWRIAAQLGYQQHFVPEHRYSILDDHTSFLQQGMNAAVVIDFDYPYWHTRYDTPDKISVDSLQRIGNVLEKLLEGEPFAGDKSP